MNVQEKQKTHNDKYFFGGNREIAIQRDGEKCVKCGMTREEHREKFNKDITVDHIDGRGVNSPPHLKNNALDNLQTLCSPCHIIKDHKHRKLTEIDYINIRHMRGSITQVEIAKLYNVTQAYISDIVNGRWGYTNNKAPEPINYMERVTKMCPHGHPRNEENDYLNREGYIVCRPCQRVGKQKFLDKCKPTTRDKK